MEIYYVNKRVEKILNNYIDMNKLIGNELTKSLVKQIRLLKTSTSFFEYKSLGIGKPHLLSGRFDKCYGVHLSANYRLIIKPMTDDLSNDGLMNCNSIEVKGVVDYHDGKDEWKIS